MGKLLFEEQAEKLNRTTWWSLQKIGWNARSSALEQMESDERLQTGIRGENTGDITAGIGHSLPYWEDYREASDIVSCKVLIDNLEKYMLDKKAVEWKLAELLGSKRRWPVARSSAEGTNSCTQGSVLPTSGKAALQRRPCNKEGQYYPGAVLEKEGAQKTCGVSILEEMQNPTGHNTMSNLLQLTLNWVEALVYMVFGGPFQHHPSLSLRICKCSLKVQI